MFNFRTRRASGLGRALVCLLPIVAFLATPVALRGQCVPDPAPEPAESLKLVVKIQTYVRDRAGRMQFRSDGSGVIVGHDESTIYVASALHVAYRQDQEPVDYIAASFFWDCEPVEATLCYTSTNMELDVTLLCVRPGTAAMTEATAQLATSLDLMAPPDLPSAATVRPVGCPRGDCFDVAGDDSVLRSDSLRVLFSTFVVNPGHSGGALFNEWFEVAGIVTRHGQPLSEAVPLQTALHHICREGYSTVGTNCAPVDLRRPRRQRGGHGLTLGAMLPLVGFVGGQEASPTATDDRTLPGGRVSLMYHPRQNLEVHAAAMRFVPVNVSVTGALFGLGYTARGDQGRLLLNLFAEGGVGHVDARYDAGGFFRQIGAGPDTEYVEFWQGVSADVLGFGTGASVQIVAPAGLVFEVLGGFWQFNKPETPEDAVIPGDFLEIPSLYVAAGLRLAVF